MQREYAYVYGHGLVLVCVRTHSLQVFPDNSFSYPGSSWL